MPSGRRRTAAVAALVGALLTLAAMAAAGGPLLSGHPARWQPHLLSQLPHSAAQPERVPSSSNGLGSHAGRPPAPSSVPHWVAIAAVGICVVGLSGLLAWLASLLLRSSVWRPVLPAIDAADAPALAPSEEEQRSTLSGRVGAALTELDEVHDPRAAVIASWHRLEAAVAELGLIRRPTETATELSERVLAALAVEPQPLVHLTSLYRMARFSPRPVAERDREEARQALLGVRQGLERPAPTGTTS